MMIEIAKKAAIKAGRKVLFLRKRGLTFKSKERYGDFATDADIASEKIILSELRKHFQNHNFVSEEAGKTDNRSEYTWVIDPYIGIRREAIERLLLPLVDKVRCPPMLGCASVGGVYVASGILDAYLHSAHSWDYAAASLIVSEAGGRVSDYQGNPIDWSKDWIDFFASNGLIHDEILSLINR